MLNKCSRISMMGNEATNRILHLNSHLFSPVLVFYRRMLFLSIHLRNIHIAHNISVIVDNDLSTIITETDLLVDCDRVAVDPNMVEQITRKNNLSNQGPKIRVVLQKPGQLSNSVQRNHFLFLFSCVGPIIHIVQTRVNTLEKKFLDFFYTANIVPFFLSLYLTITYIKFCGLKCT